MKQSLPQTIKERLGLDNSKESATTYRRIRARVKLSCTGLINFKKSFTLQKPSRLRQAIYQVKDELSMYELFSSNLDWR